MPILKCTVKKRSIQFSDVEYMHVVARLPPLVPEYFHHCRRKLRIHSGVTSLPCLPALALANLLVWMGAPIHVLHIKGIRQHLGFCGCRSGSVRLLQIRPCGGACWCWLRDIPLYGRATLVCTFISRGTFGSFPPLATWGLQHTHHALCIVTSLLGRVSVAQGVSRHGVPWSLHPLY